ncbi:hypothetical protein [Caproiciproducens sp.]|uniref:hypothetical protein n=1 Tax=Caproiciproducens sp. TaxID=1954376 RepID=UPI00289B144C|nr:hypothetical protein [Caproiciproducens sp.]
MRERRIKRLILCSVCLCAAALMPIVAALSCYAENYPDISKVESRLYYPDNQQFFHRPGTGFVLISTDSLSSTKAALLDNGGKLDYSSVRDVTAIKFAYQAAALCGNYLYLAGMSPAAADCAEIGRLDLSNGKCIINNVPGVSCDFTRDFSADAQGRVFLVTAAADTQIDGNTPASLFLFDGAHNNGTISPQNPEPASSVPVSSVPVSQPSESSDSGGSSSQSSSFPDEMPDDLPPVIENYDFSGPVTMEALQKELDENHLNQKLRVFTGDKKEVKSGNIGTGQIVLTTLNGKTASAYIAVIPGDLDGSGTVTDYDCRLLYDYFTRTGTENASVLSGPYLKAAKISDENWTDKSGRSLQTGDLLKIKKLIK